MPMPTVYEPSICIFASGSKRIDLGTTSHLYDARTFVAVSVDLPVTGEVVTASSDRPFLCMRLDIDVTVLRELVFDGYGGPPAGATPVGLVRGRTTPEMVDAAVRLLRLLEAPEDARLLAPLAEREILYRLLTGPTAGLMRHIASSDSRISQIARAIAWLRDHYRDVFTVSDLARRIGMSPSAFHVHFKAVTTMSPLQFRNALRLQSARRMMVAEGVDAATAGFEVGFQSPSQFSRDYARFFGESPLRDARRLRQDPGLWIASQP